MVEPQSLELARAATKSDWVVRDAFIKMLVNVIEVAGTKYAHEFTIDFLGKLYQDALHTIAVYEVKQLLEKRGAKCMVVFLRNMLVDLVAASSKATYFIEVKTHRPPWGGNNIKEYLAYKSFPGKVIYVWREGCCWKYASLDEIAFDIHVIRVIRSHPLEELDI